jgi:hypothetical protein
MNQHVASIVPFRKPLEALRRDEIVDCMASHLVAAILHAGLDTSSDIDVIQTLLNTPERFQSRIVLNHLDDALAEAKQQLIAREMGED